MKRFEIGFGKAHGALSLGHGLALDHGPRRAAALLHRRGHLRRRRRPRAGARRRPGPRRRAATCSGRWASPATPPTTTRRPRWPASRAPASPPRPTDVTTMTTTQGDGAAGSPPSPRSRAGCSPTDGRDHRPRPAAHLRVRRAGALPGHARPWSSSPRTPRSSPPSCGPAPSTACRSSPAAPAPGLSGGALPHADGVLIVTSQMRAITDVRREDQRAVVEPGRDQPRRHQGRHARGLLLRARPVEPADLLDRRQRRGELRRRALPEVRLHHQPRPRRRLRHRRRATPSRSAASRRTAPATTCSARSSAPRARSASSPRPPSGWSGCPRRSARSWSASRPPTRPARPPRRSSPPASCPPRSR